LRFRFGRSLPQFHPGQTEITFFITGQSFSRIPVAEVRLTKPDNVKAGNPAKDQHAFARQLEGHICPVLALRNLPNRTAAAFPAFHQLSSIRSMHLNPKGLNVIVKKP
jgi:hypothetical protein